MTRRKKKDRMEMCQVLKGEKEGNINKIK